jgi:hypothetical protein
MAENMNLNEHYKRLFFCKDENENEDCAHFDETKNDESIIAIKIFGTCWRKECLDEKKFKPIKINAPVETAYTETSGLTIKKINIKRKKPNRLKKGFWDVRIRYVFELTLIFRNIKDRELDSVRVRRVYYQNVTMDGSRCPLHTIGTDMAARNGFTFESIPFVLVRAKAVLVSRSQNLRIGLFSEISLFRPKQMHVLSDGVCAM